MQEITNFRENEVILENIKYEKTLIFNEIQQYLSTLDLIEVSMVNRFLRSKLNHRIFKGIQFSYSHLSQLPHYLNSEKITDYASINLVKDNFKKLKIDPFINELVGEINHFSNYFKSIEFFDLRRDGYFIIPLIRCYNHLTTLNICECMLGLSDFNNLMKRLGKLETLELFNLRFFKQVDEGPIENETVLPSRLKVLSISNMSIYTTNLTKHPYEFLSNYTVGFEHQPYYLPIRNISKLEKLEIYDVSYNKDFVHDFLAINSQLLMLKLPFRGFTLESIKALSNIKNLKVMEVDFNYYYGGNSIDENFPVVYSLNSLIIPYATITRYDSICQIVSIFPNTSRLDIVIAAYDSEFIINLLSKLYKLKLLKLKISKFDKNELDFCIFANVEILQIDIIAKRMIRYILPKPLMKLKSLTISSDSQYMENYNIMREAYSMDFNFKIKLIGASINCRVINNS